MTKERLTKQKLIKMILDETAKVGQVEDEAAQLAIRCQEHEFTLKDKEMRLLLDEMGPITGKNAEIRGAQLFGMTEPEHVLVMDAEAQVLRKKAELNARRMMVRSLVAIAALLSGSSDIMNEGG